MSCPGLVGRVKEGFLEKVLFVFRPEGSEPRGRWLVGWELGRRVF